MVTTTVFTSRRAIAATALAGVTALLLSGCGGVGSTDYARIRAVDAATGAGTVDLLVNGVSANGDETNPPTKQTVNVSPYLYIGTGPSILSYSSTALAAGASVGSTNAVLVSHQYYTGFVVGRPDVPSTDNRYLAVIATADVPNPPSGQAVVRVIDAAPDAGAVDVLVNGSAPASSFSDVTFRTSTTTFISAPYAPINPGSITIQVNVTGGGAAVVPAMATTVTAGKPYTIIVEEPTGGAAPTYSLQVISDSQS